MFKWFNNLQLATRIVAVTVLILVVVVAVNYVVFASGYRTRAEEAFVDKAKAFSAVADEAKNHTSALYQSGAFDEKTLAAELQRDLAAGKRVQDTRLFPTIPVVAGWTAAQEAAKREGITFRISSFDSRNPDNEPAPGSFDEQLLRDLTAQVDAGHAEYISRVNPQENNLHFMRAIRLTENCLTCHGTPGSQYDRLGTGKDLTGHQMEGWAVGKMHGSYHVVMPLAPIRSQVTGFLTSGLLWSLPLAALAIGLFVSIIFTTIRRPVQALTGITAHIAAGRLAVDVPQSLSGRADELGALARGMTTLRSSLINTLEEVTNGTGTLVEAADSMTGVSRRLSEKVRLTTERSNSVAAAAEEAGVNTASVAQGMNDATGNLESVASATEEMSATVADISSHASKARSVSEEAGAQADAAASLMMQLGAAAQEIGKVTETITNISDQTKLLALNATIEAARAGAAGKGFAVVATEIKELARQTATATEDIRAKIVGVQSSTGSAIAEIEKISGVIKDVVSIVTSIAAAIEEQAAVTRDVAGNVTRASGAVREANDRVTETATVSSTIAQDVAQISDQSQGVADDSRHIESEAQRLIRLADGLKRLVARFELK